MARKARPTVRHLDPTIVAARRTRAARRRRTTLKEWLERMPDVGTDRDFARIRSKPRQVKR